MCGIAGMVAGPEAHAAYSIYDALTVLQHRGQDAAGIASCEKGRLYLRKENGLVRDVFDDRSMTELRGNVAVGHVRYPTAGTSSCAEAQPFYVNSPYGLVIAHNGNLTNTAQLTDELARNDLRHLNTRSDSEVLLNILAHELTDLRAPMDAEKLFSAVKRLNGRCKGAYAVIGMIINHGLFAFRDPHGIRPLVFGKRESLFGTEWMIASESVALSSLGFTIVRDVAPGECVFIDAKGRFHARVCAEKTTRLPCLFEFVYLARPDSLMDGVSVYQARLRMGTFLADKITREFPDHDIDVVIPIPETSRTSALPIAVALGVPYREGFVKNRYIGRTFIMPGQTVRRKSIRQKLNPIPMEFKDLNVLLVDDSIVRGNTSRQIVEMAREAGARKVYMASAAPPVRYPNVYGIDMPAPQELVAHGRTVDDVRREIGCDWLVYQDLEALEQAVMDGNPSLAGGEGSCFSGKYITDGVTADYLHQIELIRQDAVKV